MAVIQPYDDRVVAQGSIQSQASGADFGAQVGQALGNVGAGLTSVAEAQMKIQQDQDRIWAYKASGDAYLQLQQDYKTQLNSLDPTAPDFQQKLSGLTQDFSNKIDQTDADLQSQAPSVYASKVIGSHMARNKHSLMLGAINEQAATMGAYTANQIQAGVKQDQDSLAADPSNANFQRILDNRTQQIVGMETLDPAAKMKQLEIVKKGMAVTQVQVYAATNPNGFLSAVNPQGGRVTPGGGVKGAVPGGAPAAVGGFQGATDFILRKEGGYGIDSNGAQVNFGINAAANPDVDVKNLTKDQATQLYRQRYWNAIGGDSLPANMQTVAMNIAVNQGPSAANQLLAQAGGDPVKFTELAKQRYQQIANADPSKQKYLSGWLARADDALATSTGAASNPSLPQVQPLTDQDIAGSNPGISGWQYLTWEQKVQAVRQAEAAVGGKLATERGELTRAMSDINATLLAGKAYPNIEDPKFSQDNLVRVFGPDEGRRAYDQIQYSKQVGGFISQMSTMPAAQAQQMLMSLQPQGGDEYAKKAPVFQHAMDAFVKLNKLRNDDYMAWAQNTESTGVKNIDFGNPDKFRESLTARIAPAITGRQDYGAESHLLSKDEAGQLGDLLNKMNPQDQMAYLKAVRQATIGNDAWFMDTLQQIAPKNTMLSFAAATSNKQGMVTLPSGTQQSGAMVGQYVLEGAHILQGKDLDDPTKSGRPLNIDDNKIRNFFWNSLGSNAFQSPDAQHSNQMASDTYQAVKNYLVADMYHRGMTPDKVNSDLVQNAITAVTGGTAKSPNGDTLFLPWGTSKQQFQQQFPWALNAALEKSGIKGTALDLPDAYKYMNVGDGKYLITNGNKTLVGRDGRAVIVDMSKYAGGAGAGRGFVVGQ